MNELLDEMDRQFDAMKAIAEQAQSMAEQAIKERDAARDALRESKNAMALALQLIKDNWIHEHGQEQVGNAWGALEDAIQAAKSILGDK